MFRMNIVCQIGLYLIFSIFSVNNAEATANIRKVIVGKGPEVLLHFDEAIEDGQVTTEFVRDIIQVTLKNATVYPAKITPINSEELKKVFVYQYAPSLVRVRVSVSGNAKDLKDRVLVSTNGKFLKLSLANNIETHNKKISLQKRIAAQDALTLTLGSKQKESLSNAEEEILLKNVLADKKTQKDDEANVPKKSSSQGFGKPAFDSSKYIKKLILFFCLFSVIVLCFIGGLLALRKLKSNSLSSGKINKEKAGVIGTLKSALQSRILKNEKMIDIVANHYLGPKKSIVVARVKGKLLVLGVSNDAINLITQLPEDASGEDLDLENLIGAKEVEKNHEIKVRQNIFENVLATEQSRDYKISDSKARIRNRLSNLKEL